MTQPPQDRPDYPWGPSTGSTPPVPPAGAESQPAAEETTQIPRPDLTKATPTSGGSSAWQPPAQQDAAFAYTPDPSRDQPQRQQPGTGDQQPHQGQPYTGQPAGGQAPQGYVQQGYPSGYAGQPSPYYGGGGTAPGGGSIPTSTIVLLVVSGLIFVTTVWFGVGVVWAAPAVLAIVAMTRASRDLASAKRLTRIGWWVTIGLGVLSLLLVVAAAVFFGFLFSSASYGSYDGSYDSDWGTSFQGMTTSAAYLRSLVA